MNMIRDLPKNERPRERLVYKGAHSLSSTDLLAIVLGKGTVNQSVMQLSYALLSKYGSLQNIIEASIEDLVTFYGIGQSKACQLKACFEIAKRVKEVPAAADLYYSQKANKAPLADAIRSHIADMNREHFVNISLNTRDKVIAIDTISVGSLNASLIHARELFHMAIRRHAASLIIAHNHPSGDPDPSDEDIVVTTRLMGAGNIMGIKVRDHLIVTSDRCYSLKSMGLME